MPLPNTLQGDWHFTGRVTAGEMVIPNDTLTDAAFDQPPSGGTFLDKDKVEQQITKTLGQNGTSAAERRIIHVARGPGIVELIHATSIVANIGDSVVAILLKKNGTNILTGTFQLDSADTALDSIAGVLNGSLDDYIAEDVFDITITPAVGTGTLASGVAVTVVFREDPIP